MSTGDLAGNFERLKAELKHVRYERDIDVASALKGDPATFLPMLHYVLLEFSRHVAGQLLAAGFELHAKNDLRFTEMVQKVLSSEFSYRMALTPTQFLSPGFAERKCMLVHDVVKVCRKRHNELAKKQKQRNETARRSLITNVPLTKIAYKVVPEVRKSAERSTIAYASGSGHNGDIKVDRKVVPSALTVNEMPSKEDDDVHSRTLDQLPPPVNQAAVSSSKATVSSSQPVERREAEMHSIAAAAATHIDADSDVEVQGEPPLPSTSGIQQEGITPEDLSQLYEYITKLFSTSAKALEVGMERVASHTKEMEHRLGARLTLIEGRVRMVESTLDATLQKENNQSLHTNEKTESKSEQTPSSPVVNSTGQKTTYVHSTIGSRNITALSTLDFISAVESKFAAAKLAIKQL